LEGARTFVLVEVLEDVWQDVSGEFGFDLLFVDF
jgi:hypothetical protein